MILLLLQRVHNLCRSSITIDFIRFLSLCPALPWSTLSKSGPRSWSHMDAELSKSAQRNRNTTNCHILQNLPHFKFLTFGAHTLLSSTTMCLHHPRISDSLRSWTATYTTSLLVSSCASGKAANGCSERLKMQITFPNDCYSYRQADI